MYFKLNTAMQRKVLEKNAIYKDAVKYYEKLDTYPLYPSLKTTLAAYGRLLSSTTSFKQGDELMNFIALEDKCFRSLMKYLAQVDTETLQKLTMGTTRVFDGLYSSVGAQVDDVNDRTMLYLSMRFNRRIIQNAWHVRRIFCPEVALVTPSRPTIDGCSSSLSWPLTTILLPC